MGEGSSQLLRDEGDAREEDSLKGFNREDFSTDFSAVYRVLRRLQGRHGLRGGTASPLRSNRYGKNGGLYLEEKLLPHKERKM
jgi:hypothetical protein